MMNPNDIAHRPKARSRSTAILLIQAMTPVPNVVIINIDVLPPEPKFALLLIRCRPKAITHQPIKIGTDQRSNPPRIQRVIAIPINKIIDEAPKNHNLFATILIIITYFS